MIDEEVLQERALEPDIAPNVQLPSKHTKIHDLDFLVKSSGVCMHTSAVKNPHPFQ